MAVQQADSSNSEALFFCETIQKPLEFGVLKLASVWESGLMKFSMEINWVGQRYMDCFKFVIDQTQTGERFCRFVSSGDWITEFEIDSTRKILSLGQQRRFFLFQVVVFCMI